MDARNWIVRGSLATALIGVVLLALKLLGVIALHWGLVLLPFVPLVLMLGVVVVFVLAWAAEGSH